MLAQVMSVIAFLGAHGLDLLHAFVALLSAAIAIALIIPGDQPEKALQGVLDFLSKFSRK